MKHVTNYLSLRTLLATVVSVALGCGPSANDLDQLSRYVNRHIGSQATDFEIFQLIAQSSFDRRNAEKPLTVVQESVLSIWIAEGLIGNRGFYNHTPEDLTSWIRAYRAIGSEASEILAEATVAMRLASENESSEHDDTLSRLERRYYALSDDSERRVLSHIRANPLAAIKGLETYSGKIAEKICSNRKQER